MLRCTRSVILLLLLWIPTQSIHSPQLAAAEPDSSAFVLTSMQVTGGLLNTFQLVVGSLFSSHWSTNHRFLMQIRSLQDQSLQFDDEVEVAFYRGIDQDGNPENDFMGNGTFDIHADSVDLAGDPIESGMASIDNSNLSCNIELITQLGDIPLHNVEIEGVFTPSGGLIEFQSMQILSAIPADFLATFASSVAGQNMHQALLSFGANPDTDVDGDGVNEAYSVHFSFVGIRAAIANPARPEYLVRGNVNGDGVVNIADVVSMLGYLFLDQPAPDCILAADLDLNSQIQLPDVVVLLQGLFAGQSIPEPFPHCGPSPTASLLPCDSLLECP